jgi:hypothetical protein
MSLGNLWGVNHSTSLVVVLSSVTHGSVSHPPHLPSQSSHRPTPPPPPLWSSTLMPPPPPFFSSHPLLLIAFPHTPGRGTPSQNGCVLAHPLRTSLLVAGHFPSLRMSAARVRPQQWKTVRSHPSLGQDPPDTPGRLRGNVAAVGGSWSMPAARLTTSYGISQDRSTAIGRSSPAATHGIRSRTNHPRHLPPPPLRSEPTNLVSRYFSCLRPDYIAANCLNLARCLRWHREGHQARSYKRPRSSNSSSPLPPQQRPRAATIAVLKPEAR